MAEEYTRDTSTNDNAAKTLAIIGIMIAILALVWAMKADKRAGDAISNTGGSSLSQSSLPDNTTAVDTSLQQ